MECLAADFKLEGIAGIQLLHSLCLQTSVIVQMLTYKPGFTSLFLLRQNLQQSSVFRISNAVDGSPGADEITYKTRYLCLSTILGISLPEEMVCHHTLNCRIKTFE